MSAKTPAELERCEFSVPVHQLHRFFRDGFTAADVAEALVSWEGTADAGEVGRRMDARGFDVVGVRIDGEVAGWVRREDLMGGRLVDHLRSFFGEHLMSSRAPLKQVIAGLGASPQVFITAFGAVGAIVTRADLQKAPVRMLLFGLITLVEESFTRMIREVFPGDSWQPLISAGRLEIARRLYSERQRRNEAMDLVDCLQFGDKGTVLFKDEAVRRRLGFESRSRAREVVKRLERLRNRLAHSQDIVDGGLELIVNLARELDRILEVTTQA